MEMKQKYIKYIKFSKNETEKSVLVSLCSGV